MTTCLGIYREPMCSPGRHLTNDATILELVAARLRANGHRVALATLDDAEPIRHEASLIFSMLAPWRSCLTMKTTDSAAWPSS